MSVDFFGWGLNNLVDNFFAVFSLSGLDWHVVDLSFSSVKLKLDVFGQNSWLDVFFSDGGFSWDVDRNASGRGFGVHDWL